MHASVMSVLLAKAPEHHTPMGLPGKGGVMERRHQRHLTAIEAFEDACRSLSERCNREIEDRLYKLRMSMTLSYEDSEKQLTCLESLAERNDGGLVGDELQELTLGILQEKDANRQQMMRIEQRKKELRETLACLRGLSLSRLADIDDAFNVVKKVEMSKKAALEDEFHRLLRITTEAAYCNRQENALLAERASINMNLALLENDTTTLDFVLRAKTQALQRQKQYEARFAVCYAKSLERMASHVMESCKSRFETAQYRSPAFREGLLAQLNYEYQDIRLFVKQQLDGLWRLSSSLTDWRRSAGQLMGGAFEGGWVQNPETPQVMVEEWSKALMQVPEQLHALHSNLMSKAKGKESRLMDDAQQELMAAEEDMRRIMQVDIQDEYIQGLLRCNFAQRMAAQAEAEKQLRAAEVASADDRGKSGRGRTPKSKAGKETPAPTETVIVPVAVLPLTYEEHCERLAQEFTGIQLRPVLKSIEVDGKAWIAALESQFAQLAQDICGVLLDGKGSRPLLVTFMEASAFLSCTAMDPATAETDLRNSMLAKTQEFEDAHVSKEAELCDIIDRIRTSRDGADCDALAQQGLFILEQIGQGYIQSFKERFQLLEPYQSRTDTSLMNSWRTLLNAWNLVPLEKVIAEEEAELERLQKAQVISTPEPKVKKSRSSRSESVRLGTPAAGPFIQFLANRKSVTAPRITTKNNQCLLIIKPELPVQEPLPRGQTPDKASKPPVVDKKPKKPIRKDVEEEAVVQTEERRMGQEADEQFRALVARFSEEISAACRCDMVVEVDAITNLLHRLMCDLVDWTETLRSTYLARAQAYVKQKSEELQEWKTLCARQHQRRAPDFESDVVAVRHRELQDLAEDFAKQSHWLQSRVAHGVETVRLEVRRLQSEFKSKLQDLVDRRLRLPSILAIRLLEAHVREASHAGEVLLAYLDRETQRLVKSISDINASFLLEGGRLLAKKSASLGERADQSQMESLEAIQALINSGKKTLEELHSLVTQEKQRQADAVEAEASAFQLAAKRNLQDLEFLGELHRLVVEGRGRIAALIQSSQDAERRLEEMIGSLEVRLERTTKKLEMAEPLEAMTSPSSALSAPPGTPQLAWLEYPQQVDGQLKRMELLRQQQSQASPAQELLALVDSLRKALYSRALFLNVLRYRLEFRYANETHFIEPLPPSTNDDSSGDLKPKKNPKAPTTSNHNGVFDQQHCPPEWDKFTKVTAGETTAQQWVTTTVDSSLPVIQRYYSQGRAPTRPAAIPSTEAECRRQVDGRCQALMEPFEQHRVAAIAMFRRQVTRVHVVAHRIPTEVFLGVYNLSAQGLRDSGELIRGLWNVCHQSLVAQKKTHGSSLKGSHSNPASHETVRRVADAETARQDAALKLIGVFRAFALREATGEGERLLRRLLTACGTLFTLLPSLVRPELLIEGETVVTGKHSSLKRLLKARAKHDHLDTPMAEHQEEPKMSPAKAPKAKAKDEPKAKGKRGDPEEPMPVFEGTRTEYPGLPLGEMTALRTFLAQRPEIAALPYFGDMPAVEPQHVDPKRKKPESKMAGKTARVAAKEVDKGPEIDFSPSMVGLADKVHSLCIQSRNSQYETFKALYVQLCSGLTAYYTQLQVEEEEWRQSFQKLVSNLLTPNMVT